LIDLQNGGINNSMPHTKMKKFQLLRYVKSRLSGRKNASEISPGGKALASTVFVCVAATLVGRICLLTKDGPISFLIQVFAAHCAVANFFNRWAVLRGDNFVPV
jgi:hypothetical protein